MVRRITLFAALVVLALGLVQAASAGTFPSVQFLVGESDMSIGKFVYQVTVAPGTLNVDPAFGQFKVDTKFAAPGEDEDGPAWLTSAPSSAWTAFFYEAPGESIGVGWRMLDMSKEIKPWKLTTPWTGKFTFVIGQETTVVDGFVSTQDGSEDSYNKAIKSTPAPVPEPGTMAMLATGLTGLVGSVIRRRK